MNRSSVQSIVLIHREKSKLTQRLTHTHLRAKLGHKCQQLTKRRYKEHNDGKSIHANKYRPWKLKMYIAFSDERKADKFEAFLKTGNGRAFIKKRF